MDKIEQDILKALNHTKYKARTIKGIAKETKLPKTIITQRLNSSAYLNKHVKIYPRRSKKGQLLVTTRIKFDSEATLTDKFIDGFASKRIRVDDDF